MSTKYINDLKTKVDLKIFDLEIRKKMSGNIRNFMLNVPMRVLGLGIVAPDIAEAKLNYNHNLEFEQP